MQGRYGAIPNIAIGGKKTGFNEDAIGGAL